MSDYTESVPTRTRIRFGWLLKGRAVRRSYQIGLQLTSVVHQVRTRQRNLIFRTPSTALKVACKETPDLMTSVGERELRDGVKLRRDVLFFPVIQAPSDGRLGEYFYGGLADASTRELIPEANHYQGVAYSQQLPLEYIETFKSEDFIEVKKPVYFAGILYNHFAHFMVESLCRLYAYSELKEEYGSLLFCPMWGNPAIFERDNYVNQVLGGFGIPVDKVIMLDRPARIRHVCVPEQRYGYGFLQSPGSDWMRFVRTFKFSEVIPPGMSEARQVYVARSGLKSAGSQIGEVMFENYLRDEGYVLFRPEEHTVQEQLTVYSRAERIIFADGGAIQLCILLPDLAARVAVISRRRDPRRNIPVATACLQGYGKTVVWIDELVGQYQFGLESWDALAEVDWGAVTGRLLDERFVSHRFRALSDDDQAAMKRQVLEQFLSEIASHPMHIDYMLERQEHYPAWEGPSHLIDPKSGRPIDPPPGVP